MSSKLALRRYICKKNRHGPHLLKDCSLVIDGDSFFKDSYKNSGCQFLLGPDCDKYAAYLQNQLKYFVDSNIKCYVIFKGTTRDDLEKRQKIHQQIIDNLRLLETHPKQPSYFEPLLVQDVQKQTLDLLDIKYFCCEYESMNAIIGVARDLKCPVLTDNVEYCLYGVSCIQPTPILWDEKSNSIICTMYDHEVYKSAIGVRDKMPLLLTVLSMISELPKCGNINDIMSVIDWVKRQPKNKIENIANNIEDSNKRKTFIELFYKHKVLYSYPSCNLAVKYFQREKVYGLYKDDKKWFSKGVSDGRIAIPYIDMKRKGLVTGSTVVNDILKHDAIKAASPIITYAHCLMTNSQKSTLKYIGRKNNICTTWDSENCWEEEICNREIFNKYGKMKKKPSLGNPFNLFVRKMVMKNWSPSHVFVTPFSISGVHRQSQMLTLTLVYYVQKVNKKFIDCAYYILLCHLMLGPIAKQCKLSSDNDVRKECKHMYDKLKFLFQYDNSNLKCDTSVLHSLAEFIHCLQHLNYLNNLCPQSSEFVSIRSTLYYQTYNATFVYNTCMYMKNKNRLMSYLEGNFKDSWPLEMYKSIVSQFEKYLQAS